jgi:siroheme synthase
VALLTTRAGAGERPNEWLRAALAADSVAIYMGAGEARRIARDLMAAGKPPATAVAVIENASLPDRIANFGSLQDLEAVAARGTAGPSLVLLGEVLREAAIMAAWQAKPSSSSPTARATRTGRARSGSSH